MKYIRTKYGIQQYEDYCDISYIYQTIGGIDIADTIEELCDEFVIIRDSKHYLIPSNCSITLKGIIYGAIWTDKGLIYVAKMNEKGELELL